MFMAHGAEHTIGPAKALYKQMEVEPDIEVVLNALTRTLRGSRSRNCFLQSRKPAMTNVFYRSENWVRFSLPMDTIHF